MQNFGVTNKEHYGMFWYFLERSIVLIITLLCKLTVKIFHDQGSWQVCVILTYVQVICSFPRVFTWNLLLVWQIVDLALLVKKDLEGGDMMTQVMPPVSILSESQSSVGTPATVTSTPSTPNHTPPGTPTTPTTPFLPSPTTGGTGSTSATSQNPVSKQKNKKRKLKVNSFELFSWYTCYGFFYICHNRNSFMGPSSLPYLFD